MAILCMPHVILHKCERRRRFAASERGHPSGFGYQERERAARTAGSAPGGTGMEPAGHRQ
jgi:hypothetical protein